MKTNRQHVKVAKVRSAAVPRVPSRAAASVAWFGIPAALEIRKGVKEKSTQTVVCVCKAMEVMKVSSHSNIELMGF